MRPSERLSPTQFEALDHADRLGDAFAREATAKALVARALLKFDRGPRVGGQYTITDAGRDLLARARKAGLCVACGLPLLGRRKVLVPGSRTGQRMCERCARNDLLEVCDAHE